MWNGLDYSVAIYDDRGNLVEWIARTKSQADARIVFDRCIATWPEQRFVLRQRTRVIRDTGRKIIPFP